MTAFNQVSLKPSNQPAMIGSKRHSSSSYFRLSLKDDYKHLWTSSYIQEARKRGMGVPLFLSLIKARFGQLRCSSNCTPTVKGTPIGGSEKSTKPRSTPSDTSTQTQPRADQRLEIRSNWLAPSGLIFLNYYQVLGMRNIIGKIEFMQRCCHPKPLFLLLRDLPSLLEWKKDHVPCYTYVDVSKY